MACTIFSYTTPQMDPRAQELFSIPYRTLIIIDHIHCISSYTHQHSSTKRYSEPARLLLVFCKLLTVALEDSLYNFSWSSIREIVEDIGVAWCNKNVANLALNDGYVLFVSL